eukprot:3937265-Rhodomonas_salina.6
MDCHSTSALMPIPQSDFLPSPCRFAHALITLTRAARGRCPGTTITTHARQSQTKHSTITALVRVGSATQERITAASCKAE